MTLEDLDAYLTSDDSPDECMQLSDLDGFLTGILCSPDLMPPSEWLPIVWGGPEPDVDDLDRHIAAIEAVLARYNEIAAFLNSEPSYIEPIFWQTEECHVIAMDWCEGFMRAVRLNTEVLDELLGTEKGREWVFPILAHLFDEDGRSLVGAEESLIDALLDWSAERIPETVPNIFAYWQAKRSVLSGKTVH